MTADLEKLAGEIEEHHAGRDTCNPYDRAFHEARLQHLMLDNAPAIVAALREVSALREALEPFAKAGELFVGSGDGFDMWVYKPVAGSEYGITAEHLRNARRALATGEKP